MKTTNNTQAGVNLSSRVMEAANLPPFCEFWDSFAPPKCPGEILPLSKYSRWVKVKVSVFGIFLGEIKSG